MHKATLAAIGVFVMEGALQISGYQNPTLAMILLLGGIVLLVPQAYETLPKWVGNLWGKKKRQASEGFISMKDAAASLYTEARSSKHVMARGAEKLSGWSNGGPSSGSHDDILDWMATYIAHGKKVPIYGKRPPSTIQEQIHDNDVRASHFVEGATKLQQIHNEKSYFVDLEIKSTDLERLIAETQMDVGFYESPS